MCLKYPNCSNFIGRVFLAHLHNRYPNGRFHPQLMNENTEANEIIKFGRES